MVADTPRARSQQLRTALRSRRATRAAMSSSQSEVLRDAPRIPQTTMPEPYCLAARRVTTIFIIGRFGDRFFRRRGVHCGD